MPEEHDLGRAQQCLIGDKFEVEFFSRSRNRAVLGKTNDVVDEQFHSFEAFANLQHDGLEPTRE